MECWIEYRVLGRVLGRWEAEGARWHGDTWARAYLLPAVARYARG